MQLAGIIGKNWRRRWTSRTQDGRVGHWYAGLVLLNNHSSQHIRQSAPMPLPLMSSRLLKHRTTRSLNARFVCRAELFCSRCQTRVFPIHSRKRRFQLLCRRWNQRQPQVTTTSTWNSWRTWAPKLAPGSKFFSRIMATHSIPKIWRKAKVIAVEKPGKDPSLAANYRPISLLSLFYKLLERLALQRISPTVEGLLSPDQAGFRKGRSTCDQVADLTTFTENRLQQNRKTGAVFLDLTAAYDTVWDTGFLYKLSKSMPYWFTRLVGLLLRDWRFRVHMGNDTSSWRRQRNGLPQGCVLAPVLFNLYSNDVPVTHGRKFIYAEDICLTIQGQYFSELECSLVRYGVDVVLLSTVAT